MLWPKNIYQLERVTNALLRRDVRHFGFYLQHLSRRNRLSQRPIIQSGGPVVSLTTYGNRLNTVHLAIETIAAGSLLPSRIILWLDEPLKHQLLPGTLKRLEARGLEIREARNFGPHTKYFPYVDAMHGIDQPLITADDDVLYPKDWVAGLIAAYRQAPDVLNCYRAHVVRIEDGAISPYASWTSCRCSEPSFLNFATAVSGSVLPPRLLRRLKAAGTAFTQLCPTADDIWLHVNAIREGIRIKQIRSWQRNFPEVPGTQNGTLSDLNFHRSQNDAQIAKTYTADDLAILNNEAAQRLGSKQFEMEPHAHAL
jgi:hypothetical protein